MLVNRVKLNIEFNEIWFTHRFGYGEYDYLVPTNIKIVGSEETRDITIHR